MAASEPKAYGNFELEERIAVGGMAEIFRAKKKGAEGFEKELVIKRILPHYSEDEAFVTMFKDEAKIAANLNHANIVQIYEFDQCEGSFYIAMEYIEGKDLKRILDAGRKRKKPVLPAECVYVIAQVADALHYAHTRAWEGQQLNIVHRDVSPHNIIVSFDGDVKLMDFGIAKAAARSTKTQAGTVKGKCAYMSPEQARGLDLDGRSDLFSLGICLWEMLTTQRLFTGDTEFEILSKVLKAQIPSPREFNPDVHAKLEQIVRRSLSRDRADRFADLGKFKQALMSFFYQYCDPDVIDLGAYMRWLYRRGELPRSRQPHSQAPPPTISTPAYRPPGGAARPTPTPLPAMERSAPTPAQDPPPGPDQTAVMPEMVDPQQTLDARPPRVVAEAPPPDPTMPIEPYRPSEAGPPPTVDARASTRKEPQDPRSSTKTPAERPEKKGPGKKGASGGVRGGRGAAVRPKKASSGSSKGLFVGLGVAALLLFLGVAGVLGYHFLSGPQGTGADSGADPAVDAGSVRGEADTAPPAATQKVIVEVTSEPPGADLRVNGEAHPLPTPTRLKGLKVGDSLRLRIRKTGYRSERLTVEVKEGMEPVHVVLKRR